MRWSIIRLIWLRELRDQLRDRRTLFTIVALPLLLYPVLSFVVLQFSLQLLRQHSTVGILVGPHDADTFPRRPETGAERSPLPMVSWLALTPAPGVSLDHVLGAAALAEASHETFDFPVLYDHGQLSARYQLPQNERLPIFAGSIQLEPRFLYGNGQDELKNKEVDLLLSAPPDFLERIVRGEQARVDLLGRAGDDRSRRAAEQLSILLGRWKKHLREVRLRRTGLPPGFDEPFAVRDENRQPTEDLLAAESMLDLLVRTFPFLLVMWSLIGALHPAIDLCAGEKERGTMETLLISPAGRAEIVYGKFLTIWVFSAGTSVLHLLSMSVSTWQLRAYLPQAAVTLPAVFWCVLLVLPLAALFSAVCLAIGAYARSTKEGQYYLMPLFWVTMPLMLITLAPGVELNQFYSMVPVTGVALLMQRLMIAPNLEAVPWFYFLPVFGTVLLYSWLTLRWAIWQFQREEVLFREAERWPLGLWLRQIFRRSEALPSLGQAMLCLAVLLVLRWFSLRLGSQRLELLERNTIMWLAFVAAPPLFMSLLLTTRPRLTLALYWPNAGYLVVALLLLPLAELAHSLLNQFPALNYVFQGRREYVDDAFRRLGEDSNVVQWAFYLSWLGILSAASEEVAFRGFILSGLLRRFSPWPALLLCAFFFAVFHMNVFTLAPFFVLGLVAGVLTARSGSLLPAIVLHAGCNILLLAGPLVQPNGATEFAPQTWPLLLLIGCAVLGTMLAGWLLWRLEPAAKGRYPRPPLFAPRQAEKSKPMV
jgi:sodium transport system permease protein